MKKSNEIQLKLSNIPSVNKVLESSYLKEHRKIYKHHILKKIVQEVLQQMRQDALESDNIFDSNTIMETIKKRCDYLLKPSLRRVINATGIILNTNLGRAPLGEDLIAGITPVTAGYNNLEFDLTRGERGSRHSHLRKLMKILLDCEDAIVVNNNAAALFLTLKSLTQGKEVIVSRGELVEIGGSFRIPEIIACSGAKMVEVGTTNKTKLSDYQNAINENTAAILKVHKSNYYIGGFTEEVSLKDITVLAKENSLLSVFDFGTGLPDRSLISKMCRQKGHEANIEPDIKTAMNIGIDIVTFSCDKLLGGPQAGIIAGKGKHINHIKKDPVMRVLRVDKLIISALTAAMGNLLMNDDLIVEKVPLFRYLNRDESVLKKLAESLAKKIKDERITVSVVDNEAKCGGGTMPDYYLKSKAVMLEERTDNGASSTGLIERLYYGLLKRELPVVAFLREGKLCFDVITLEESDIKDIGTALAEISVAL